MIKSRGPSVTTLVLAILLFSLMVSGVMVVRLIDRVSETELQERRDALESGMLGFRAALVGTLFRAASESHPGPPSLFLTATSREDLAEEFLSSDKRSSDSQLISGLALGIRAENGQVQFEQFDRAKRTFVRARWPEEIASYQAALEAEKPEERQNGERRPGFAFLQAGERPMIVLPLLQWEGRARETDVRIFRPFWRGPRGPNRDGDGVVMQPGSGQMPIRPEPGEQRPRIDEFDQNQEPDPNRPRRRRWQQWEAEGRGDQFPGNPPSRIPGPGDSPDGRFPNPPGSSPARTPPRLAGWCFLLLDFEKLKGEIVPQLLSRHFQGREREFSLAVVNPAGPQVIAQSGAPVDLREALPLDAALSLIERRGPPNEPRNLNAPSTPVSDVTESVTVKQAIGSLPSGWLLVARHRDGSLESVVGRNRWRSIALTLSLLGLLGTSAILLVWNSRRSKQLAQRQMEFVAGVSHELLTPLSVIRTAASNLSRGLITDREKGLEYGRTLEKESKRLTKMVEQVLSFAALQSGARRSRQEPVDVGEVMREIVSEYRPSLEQQGWQICEDIGPVGRSHIDRRAMESLLYNLIDNATKYASSGRWLRVSATRENVTSRALVRITVEDHGPGIAPEDLRHIFKPFYRGRGLAASNVPGAGLGLSIVRQQLRSAGAKISVASSARGCVFTVLLPAAE